MKLGFTYLIFVMYIGSSAFAQSSYIPFPEDSAQWSVRDVSSDTIGHYVTNTTQYKMRGDSIINGINFNKIYKSDDLNYISPSDSLWCFIRQDTSLKQVYIRYPYFRFNDSTESLLYDFSLNDNDTLNFKLFSDGNYYNAIVTNSTDSVYTHTGVRRSLDMVIPGTVFGGGCDFFNIAEGIGNTNHPFYVEMPFYYCGTHVVTVQCFWHNGSYVTGGSYCDFISNEEEINKSNIQVMQTSNALLVLNQRNERIQFLLLTDSYGKRIFYQSEINGNLNINSELLLPGIYYLQMRYGVNIITKKILIIN